MFFIVYGVLPDIASSAPACSSVAVAQNGISVAPSHSKAFYIDTGVISVLDSGYIGYRVTNNIGSNARDSLQPQQYNLTSTL